MVDLGLAVLLCFALLRAARHRSRVGLHCLAAGLLALGVLALLSLAGWRGDRFVTFGMAEGAMGVGTLSGVWILVLFGPAALPARGVIPLSGAMEAWPMLFRAVIAAAPAYAVLVAMRAAEGEIQESDAQHALNELANAFTACAVAAVFPLLVLGIGGQLSGP